MGFEDFGVAPPFLGSYGLLIGAGTTYEIGFLSSVYYGIIDFVCPFG